MKMFHICILHDAILLLKELILRFVYFTSLRYLSLELYISSIKLWLLYKVYGQCMVFAFVQK